MTSHNNHRKGKTQTKKIVFRVAFQLYTCSQIPQTLIAHYCNQNGLFCQQIIGTDAVYYFGYKQSN